MHPATPEGGSGPFAPIRFTIKNAIAQLGFGDEWVSPEGGVSLELFRWPPDVFAMAATLLRDSGAYLQAARPHDYSIPEAACFRLDEWSETCTQWGAAWSMRDWRTDDPPERVRELLGKIGCMASMHLHELSKPDADHFRWLPFLQLMCIADEAGRSAGITCGIVSGELGPRFISDNVLASQMLLLLQGQHLARSANQTRTFEPTTLCRVVDRSRAIVLPKMRTSQRGITIRSFSHHLSLVNGSDVEPIWTPASRAALRSEHHAAEGTLRVAGTLPEARPYNLLLVPWPFHVDPVQFQPFHGPLAALGQRPPKGHRLFSFKHREPPHAVPRSPDLTAATFRAGIDNLLKSATSHVGPIHGLVFPEMAMTRDFFNDVFESAIPAELEFITCGVYEPPSAEKLGRNYAIVRRRALGSSGRHDAFYDVEQEKHHRWALDHNQIAQYSLGTSLHPATTWWEGIDLQRRSLQFFGLDAGVAFTVLICEDLARPDPVADVVRAVGPNLVICLLLDGPQLARRWSTRYATVLADDPGSSVLTLTSLGMVTLSKPREKEIEGQSRVVALWRESSGAPKEIVLPSEAKALVLSLTAETYEELSLDGRDDNCNAVKLHLNGSFPLFDDLPAKEPGPNPATYEKVQQGEAVAAWLNSLAGPAEGKALDNAFERTIEAQLRAVRAKHSQPKDGSSTAGA